MFKELKALEEDKEKPECEVCEKEAIYKIEIIGEDEFYACEEHKHDF